MRGSCVGMNCVVVEMIGSGMVGCVGSNERSRAVKSPLVRRCWMVWLMPFDLRHWKMGCIWSCLFVLVLLTWAVGGVCRKGPLGDVLRAVHQMVSLRAVHQMVSLRGGLVMSLCYSSSSHRRVGVRFQRGRHIVLRLVTYSFALVCRLCICEDGLGPGIRSQT